MPHDPDFISKYVAETLQKAESFEQKQEAAKVFYAERREGKIANWVSYTDSQIRGSVPPGWLESPFGSQCFLRPNPSSPASENITRLRSTPRKSRD